MTYGPVSPCSRCTHFVSPFAGDDFNAPPSCAAFPDGIPADVLANRVDHRQPVPGDHGVRWQSDGRPFPEGAFDPAALAE